jgi:hypothetical protein
VHTAPLRCPDTHLGSTCANLSLSPPRARVFFASSAVPSAVVCFRCFNYWRFALFSFSALTHALFLPPAPPSIPLPPPPTSTLILFLNTSIDCYGDIKAPSPHAPQTALAEHQSWPASMQPYVLLFFCSPFFPTHARTHTLHTSHVYVGCTIYKLSSNERNREEPKKN